MAAQRTGVGDLWPNAYTFCDFGRYLVNVFEQARDAESSAGSHAARQEVDALPIRPYGPLQLLLFLSFSVFFFFFGLFAGHIEAFTAVDRAVAVPVHRHENRTGVLKAVRTYPAEP